MPIPPQVGDFIADALREDIRYGDITTESIIEPDRKSRAFVIAKQDTVAAGLDFFAEVFRQVDPSVKVIYRVKDSRKVEKGSIICEIKGFTKSILKAERVALNILQRLSGIAALTAEFVRLIEGTGARVVDTRKTTPCMRFMEKYAVRAGGGYNHRFGLYDGILIKDNHIAAAGGIKNAVKKAKEAHHLLKIEVEVKNIKELREALKAEVDVVMLDNMSIETMKKAVQIVRSSPEKPLIEASGNVSLDNVRDIAETGVDLISVGMITHSPPATDMSLKIM